MIVLLIKMKIHRLKIWANLDDWDLGGSEYSSVAIDEICKTSEENYNRYKENRIAQDFLIIILKSKVLLHNCYIRLVLKID